MAKTSKRAQAASSAATFIIILVLIIFLYIILLPPESRQALLEGNITDSGEIISAGSENLTLLLSNPGTLEFIDEREISHTIPSIRLFTKIDPRVVKELPTAYIKSAWFDSKPLELSFDIDNPVNYDNFLLTANIKKAKGKIVVKLNGNEIYSNEVTGGNFGPIKLPKDYIQQNNKIRLESAGVGLRFWQTNEYDLQNFKITADFQDKSTLKGRSVFLVSSTENSNLEKATLKLSIDCTTKDIGTIDISVNGHSVYSSVPDCGSRVSIPFSQYYVTSGENTIEFTGTKGVYSIYQATVDTELREISNPVYYFELSKDQYQSVKKGKRDVVFRLKFADSISNKKADLVINSHISSLDDKDALYEKNINEWIEEGTNTIKIYPKSTLEMAELKVYLE